MTTAPRVPSRWVFPGAVDALAINDPFGEPAINTATIPPRGRCKHPVVSPFSPFVLDRDVVACVDLEVACMEETFSSMAAAISN